MDEADASGIIVDFKTLKGALDRILENLDHQLLNDIIVQPSAENVALEIGTNFPKHLVNQVNEVRVYESPDCCAIWRPVG
jgi:6-pyruvoyltetrahydropterin/6-carboxytetrahydropterin synthase